MTKFLVVGAHLDDCPLGCAGTALHALAAGHRVIFATMTDGRLGGDSRLREIEDQEACAILGVERKVFALPDGEVSRRAVAEHVRGLIAETNPTAVFTHYPSDSHQDHVTVGEAVIGECRSVSSLYFFEGPTTRNFPAIHTVDITSVWDIKCKSLGAYASQEGRVGLIEWADVASRFRSWPRYRSCRCEGFVAHHSDINAIIGRADERAQSRFSIQTRNISELVGPKL